MSKLYTRDQVLKLIQEKVPAKFEDFSSRSTRTEFTQDQVDLILGNPKVDASVTSNVIVSSNASRNSGA